MAETDPTDPPAMDRDTKLVGLTAIGTRLYEHANDVSPDSTLAAERAVFAHQFDPLWGALTNDDRRWLREKLDHEDGVFDRVVAGFEARSTANALAMDQEELALDLAGALDEHRAAEPTL